MDVRSNNTPGFLHNSVFNGAPLRNAPNSPLQESCVCNPYADKGLKTRSEKGNKYLHEMKVASHSPEVNVLEVVSSADNNSAVKVRVDNVIKKACSDITTTVCHKTTDQLLEKLRIFQAGEEKQFEANSPFDMHRVFSIFKDDSQLFNCTLASRFPSGDRSQLSAHHFLVVKVGRSWRLCQSMADRYTLSDFVTGHRDFISNFILLCNKIHGGDSVEVGDKSGLNQHDLNSTEKAVGRRKTIKEILKRILCAQGDIEKMLILNEWLDHGFFVKTVLPLLGECLKNVENDCFLKLFGAGREFLKTEGRGKLVLSTKGCSL